VALESLHQKTRVAPPCPMPRLKPMRQPAAITCARGLHTLCERIRRGYTRQRRVDKPMVGKKLRKLCDGMEEEEASSVQGARWEGSSYFRPLRDFGILQVCTQVCHAELFTLIFRFLSAMSFEGTMTTMLCRAPTQTPE